MTRFKSLMHPGFFALFFFVSLLPTIYCMTMYFTKNQKIATLSEEFDALIPFVNKVLTNKNCLPRFLQQFQHTNRLYCEQYLENLSFLHTEIEQLKFLSSYQAFANCSMLKKRRDHLCGNGNRICFTSGSSNEAKGVKESEEKLMHPIEVDCHDLQRLLSLIEGISIGQYYPPDGRPQLIFKTFDLQKRKGSHGGENYAVNFELIKREKVPTN